SGSGRYRVIGTRAWKASWKSADAGRLARPAAVSPDKVGGVTSTHGLKRALLRDLLKRVSRLFYTTLTVVPADVRDQVSLAYLFARAADTIADTELIDRPRRLDYLGQLKAQFVSDQVSLGQIREIQQAVVTIQQDSAERQLLERLDECFGVLQEFSLRTGAASG